MSFAGKTAVITGAASGIGQALAWQFAREGSRVVLADIDASRLEESVSALAATGARCVGVHTDVSKLADNESLAQSAIAAFGAVDIVCLNAGLATLPGAAWEKSQADWELTLSVNLWGVINGVRVFLPLLLEQGTQAHVAITASAAGLLHMPHAADYFASKHAVVSIAESVSLDLLARNASIKISVLCPGFVKTNILAAASARPGDRQLSAGMEKMVAEQRQIMATEATPPEELAVATVEAMRQGRFWIFPHPELKTWFERRCRCVMDETPPALPPEASS